MLCPAASASCAYHRVRMKQVYSARDVVEAHLVKSFLDEKGIESVIQGAALASILGAIPVTRETLPGIWVRDEDEDRATDAIAGFKAEAKPAQPTAGTWTCPNCGEVIEPQFTECWKCGASRPAAVTRDEDAEEESPTSRSRPILRWHVGADPEESKDELAHEEPLEIRVRGRAVSVTMRTPGHDDELAAGFLATEGMIKRREDVLRIEPCGRNEEGNLVNVQLAPEVSVDFDKLTRHVFASSSCGLCGKATIDAVRGQFEPIRSDVIIEAQTLLSLPEKMRQTQSTFDRTGGLHAAAIFSSSGELIVLREDVGRHNALDKVIGHGLLNGLLPYDNHILLVSGRTSFEIMQKALAARVPVIAAVSAPSSLAVDFAMESGQTLVGFLRGERMNIYAGEQRIRFT